MQADDVSEVIDALDRIIERARERRSRTGYFPALYRTVTEGARQGIAGGEFEDPDRMARLVVNFANRYLDAHARHEAGKRTSRAWQVAFDATGRHWPVVLQHLLLGINAHVNLDLGIAAADTSPGREIHALRRDFERINGQLVQMVDGVTRKLTEVWPMLALLDRAGGRSDEAIVEFSITKARDCAWEAAERLAQISDHARRRELDRLDRMVARLGMKIRRPGLPVRAVLVAVRLTERGSVPEVIDILARSAGEVRERIGPSTVA